MDLAIQPVYLPALLCRGYSQLMCLNLVCYISFSLRSLQSFSWSRHSSPFTETIGLLLSIKSYYWTLS
jgi:hypothetical protein